MISDWLDLDLLERERKGLAPAPANRKASEAKRNDAAAHNTCSDFNCTTSVPSVEEHLKKRGYTHHAITEALKDLATHKETSAPAPEFVYLSEWECVHGIHYSQDGMTATTAVPQHSEATTEELAAAYGKLIKEAAGPKALAVGRDDGSVALMPLPRQVTTLQAKSPRKIHEAVTLYDFDRSAVQPGDVVHVVSSHRYFLYHGQAGWTILNGSAEPLDEETDYSSIVAWFQVTGAVAYVPIRLLETWRSGYYVGELVVDRHGGDYWRWGDGPSGLGWRMVARADLLREGKIKPKALSDGVQMLRTKHSEFGASTA